MCAFSEYAPCRLAGHPSVFKFVSSPARPASLETSLPVGKPTGEALMGKTFANRKTLAPAGRASRGASGPASHRGLGSF